MHLTLPVFLKREQNQSRKAGAKRILLVSNVGTGFQAFGPFSAALSDHMQVVKMEVEQPGCELEPVCEFCCLQGEDFLAVDHCVGPYPFF